MAHLFSHFARLPGRCETLFETRNYESRYRTIHLVGFPLKMSGEEWEK